MKRLWKGILLAAVALLIIPAVALASYTWYINITTTSSVSYTNIPLYATMDNDNLYSTGFMTGGPTYTKVYNPSGTAVPHMVADSRTWFVAPSLTAGSTESYRYTTSESAATSLKIIPGYDGYITTNDNALLEASTSFDISISGYWDTSSSARLAYKQGAYSVNVTSANTVAFIGLNADDSVNWSLSGSMVSGSHTMRAYSQGSAAYLEIDGLQVDSQSLITGTDASVIASSATWYGYQATNRAAFYNNNLWWIFIANNQKNLVYYTSNDSGVSWSSPVALTSDNAVDGTGRWSLWFDNTNLCYARRSDGSHFKFRKGTPQSDGSITWAAAEQSIAVPVMGNTISIAVEASSGCAQVIVYTAAILVYRNDNTDGTWSTTAGYPHTLWTSTHSHSDEIIISDDDSNKMYAAAYDLDTKQFVGCYYNGTTWTASTETIASGSGTTAATISATFMDNDDILLVMQSGVANPNSLSYYCVRDSSGTIGTRYDLVSAGDVDVTCKPMISYDPLTDQAIIWYVGRTDYDIYYKIYSDTGLSSSSKLLATTCGTSISVPQYLSSGKAGIANISGNNLQYSMLSFSWAWNDSNYDWYWMTGNVLSYCDNISVSVDGTQRLLYRPDSIILGTALPDESGNSMLGEFHWGSMPTGVSATPGDLTPYDPPSTPTSPAGGWSLIPTTPTQPTGLYTEGGECMLGITELANASAATGNPRALFPILLAFGLSLLFGFIVYGATYKPGKGMRGSLFLMMLTSLVVLIFFVVGGCGIIPGWVLIPFGVIGLFLLISRNPQSSHT